MSLPGQDRRDSHYSGPTDQQKAGRAPSVDRGASGEPPAGGESEAAGRQAGAAGHSTFFDRGLIRSQYDRGAEEWSGQDEPDGPDEWDGQDGQVGPEGNQASSAGEIPGVEEVRGEQSGAGYPAGDEAQLDPLSAALAERDEYLDALRRLQAELENYRKRIARQQKEYAERATEGLVIKLLPVFDALDLAVRHAESLRSPSTPDDHPRDDHAGLRGDSADVARSGSSAPSEPTILSTALAADEGSAGAAPEGLSQIRSMLLGSLEREGLLRVDPRAGDPFDPSLHEAVIHSPSDNPDDTGHAEPVVEEVLRVGYCWNGRMVRAAMVKVKG
jgi:molecular chaperone GrpE (heat shock protein)